MRKLDLRTGKPVWFSYRAPAVRARPLTRDVKADVAIVGMGISGAMMAEALTARGLDVLCIDRRGPMKGSTPATTALVQFEIDQPMTTLSGMIGRGKAEQAWRRSRLAVENLAARIEELDIACNFTRRPSLYLSGTLMGPAELKQEAEARMQAGIRARYMTRSTLKSEFQIDRDAAVLSSNNIELDPRKLTAGMLKRAEGRGARFYAKVEATGIHHSADAVTLTTREGPVITAGHVVLATGYELLETVPAARHSVISTWAIATRPQPARLWPQRAFIWEASDPYLYMRTTPDGRVICGGEDEDFEDEDRRDALIGEKTARIAQKLAKMFPQLDVEPEFVWAGSFGSTSTGLPYIGAVPRMPRVHAVMGYGGNGITYSQIASEIVATAIAGGKDTDADLFSFTR